MTELARTRLYLYLALQISAPVVLSGPLFLAIHAIKCGMTGRTSWH